MLGRFRHALCKIFSTSAGPCGRRGLPLRALSGCVHGYGVSGPQVLVCSDAMTRGMDVENVANVISYDAPVYAKVTAPLLTVLAFH